MATLNQPFSLGSSKGMTGRITVTQVMDIQTNKSTVSIALEFKNTSYYGHRYYLNGSVKVDGSTIANLDGTSSHSVMISKKDTFYEVVSSPYKTTVSHGPDGSKTIEVAVSVKGSEVNGAASNGFSVSKTTTVVLETIPRASKIGATDTNVGSSSTVTVNRKSTTYTHSIEFTFCEESGYITEDGGISATEVKLDATSIAFAIPNSFYAQIPSKKSDTCSLVCRTYSGDTQIGDAQSTSFTITAAETLCAPQFSGTVEDINPKTIALTGDATTLVRYVSEALCTISATARNEATIEKKLINGQEISGDTLTIPQASASSVDFLAIDSRGYPTNQESAKVTVPVTMIPYIPLTCVASGKRTNPTDGNATLTIKGDYFNGSFGAVSNTLSIKCTINGGNEFAVIPVKSGNKYTATLSLSGLDYMKSHEIVVSVTDAVGSVTQPAIIGKGIPVFDWGENDFAFNVPVYLKNGAYDASGNPIGAPNTSTIVDMVYPVGSIYMSANDVSPEVLFGGEWEQLKDRFLLGAGDTYSNGSTGGEASHTLTVGEIPSHTHDAHTAYGGKTSGDLAVMRSATLSNQSTTTVSRTKETGGGAAHNNMPPYQVVYMWKRTA